MDSFLKTPKKQQQKNKAHENRKKPKLDQFQKILAHFGFSENPKKSKKIRKNPEKSKNPKKNHFLDFHSLTPAAVLFPLEQSLILLGRIHVSAHLLNNKELVHFHSQSTTKY